MLTKKDVVNLTKAVACFKSPISGGLKVFKNCQVSPFNSKELWVTSRDMAPIYLPYPTKKDQKGFRLENGQIIWERGNLKIVLE